jgi:hypothetical protein
MPSWVLHIVSPTDKPIKTLSSKVAGTLKETVDKNLWLFAHSAKRIVYRRWETLTTMFNSHKNRKAEPPFFRQPGYPVKSL